MEDIKKMKTLTFALMDGGHSVVICTEEYERSL